MKKYLTILLTLFIVSCNSLEKRTEKFLQDPVNNSEELTLDEWKSQALNFANNVKNNNIVNEEMYEIMCERIELGYNRQNKFNWINNFDEFSPCTLTKGSDDLERYWKAHNVIAQYTQVYDWLHKQYPDIETLISDGGSLMEQQLAFEHLESAENDRSYIGNYYIITETPYKDLQKSLGKASYFRSEIRGWGMFTQQIASKFVPYVVVTYDIEGTDSLYIIPVGTIANLSEPLEISKKDLEELVIIK